MLSLLYVTFSIFLKINRFCLPEQVGGEPCGDENWSKGRREDKEFFSRLTFLFTCVRGEMVNTPLVNEDALSVQIRSNTEIIGGEYG